MTKDIRSFLLGRQAGIWSQLSILSQTSHTATTSTVAEHTVKATAGKKTFLLLLAWRKMQFMVKKEEYFFFLS